LNAIIAGNAPHTKFKTGSLRLFQTKWLRLPSLRSAK
jgi:hypothetical protein